MLFALLLTLITPVAWADSFWNHNGSVMRLQADGAYRWMTYQDPRPGMRDQGVQPGTLLFDGYRDGDRYVGTARVFSRNCAAPMAYAMNGYVRGDTLIVLEGMRPVFRNCRATGEMRWETLSFTCLYSDDARPAPQSGRIDIVTAATERGVDILLGDPYGRNRVETRAFITGVERGGAGYCGPNDWVVRVVVPKPADASLGRIDGHLGLDPDTGDIVCTNLPLLD